MLGEKSKYLEYILRLSQPEGRKKKNNNNNNGGGGGGGKLLGVEMYRYKLRGSRQSCLLCGAIRTTPRSRGLKPKLLGCPFFPYRPSTAGP